MPGLSQVPRGGWPTVRYTKPTDNHNNPPSALVYLMALFSSFCHTEPLEGGESAAKEPQFDAGKLRYGPIVYAREVRALASGVSIPQGEACIFPCRNSQSSQPESGWEGWGFHPTSASVGRTPATPEVVTQVPCLAARFGGARSFKPRGPPGISSAGTRHSGLEEILKEHRPRHRAVAVYRRF